MAQKYIVKNQDNFLSLGRKFASSPAQLMSKNKIKTLTPGQTILIPNPPKAGGGVNYNSTGYQNNLRYVNPNGTVGFQTPTFGTGSGLISQTGFVTPKFGTGNFFTPKPANLPLGGQNDQKNVTTPVLPTGSFASGGGNANTQLGMQSLLGTTFSQGGTNVTPQQPAPAVKPTGVYTGGNDENSKAWRLYWNKQADPNWNGNLETHIYKMSKSDVWNMKANARKRKQDFGEAPVVKPAPKPLGNAENSSLSWRI